MTTTNDKITETLSVAMAGAVLNDSLGKKWYSSRTLWANVIAAVALLAQIKFGFVFDAGTQALALTFVNVILRKLTNEPIVF